MRGRSGTTYRDSWVKAMYEAGFHYKGLMRVSGIKQKETIDRKIHPASQDLEMVFKDIYARIRVSQK